MSVAVAVAIGARISGVGFVIASKQALRLGAVGFLVPYTFVANPSIIVWSFPETLFALPVLMVAVVAVTIASIGYDGQSVLGPVHRVGYLALAFLTTFDSILDGVGGPMVATTVQFAAAAMILVLIVLTQYERLPAAVEPVGHSQ